MIKKYRIRKNEEFTKIISRKHSRANGTFIMYFQEKTYDYARVGLSVSKKLGNAVVRNKIKRQIRNMLVSSFDFENSPCDLILIARKSYLEHSFSQNQSELEKLIKKAII